MKLRLVTNARTEKSLIGELFVDAEFECYTMENPKHLIPAGEYGVIINESQRFKRRMPLLVNVPGREGIRIHVANWAHELDGCIAVGRTIIDPDMIGQSRIAFDRLFFKLDDALTKGESASIEVIRSGGKL
jgi:hypothetical protein